VVVTVPVVVVGPVVLVYRRNVVVAVLMVVVGAVWTDHDQQYCYHHVPTVNQKLLLQLKGS
jgi:hypothetical protein